MNDIVYRLKGQKLTVEEIVEIYSILDRECNRIIKEKREKREAEAKSVCTVSKRVAFRYYGKPIYYPAEHAIFDLHIPAGKHYVWHGIIYISTGIVRSVNENDIRDILLEDNLDFYNTDLIQDTEHPTDLYVVDKV